MRLGEVLALNDDDIDWKDQVLIVRRAKFGKSRLIPVHASTMAALACYVRQRNRTTSPTIASPLFPSSKGMRLRKSTVYISFRILLQMVGLRRKTDHHGPHLHDFRHRFAVNTLVRAYRAGLDVERRMFLLSTYLGHVDAESTFWYLSAAPELMGEARKRLERSVGRLP
jgi:integrase